MARGTAHIGSDSYTTRIEVGGHTLTGDEPARNGGHGEGPAPYEFLLAGLASCTAITLRMYADRKQWPVSAVNIDLHLTHAEDGSLMVRRTLDISGDIDQAQKARMLEIAEKTPVTLTLKTGMQIDTDLA